MRADADLTVIKENKVEVLFRTQVPSTYTVTRGGHIGLVSGSVWIRFGLVNLGFIKLNPIKTKVALVWVRFGFSLVRFSSVWFRFSLVL